MVGLTGLAFQAAPTLPPDAILKEAYQLAQCFRVDLKAAAAAAFGHTYRSGGPHNFVKANQWKEE